MLFKCCKTKIKIKSRYRITHVILISSRSREFTVVFLLPLAKDSLEAEDPRGRHRREPLDHAAKEDDAFYSFEEMLFTVYASFI